MQFLTDSTSDDVRERDFVVGDVPGVLWTPPAETGAVRLVLMGHPGGLDKKARGVVARAHQLVTSQGIAVLSIDAPGHGERPRSPEDAAWVERMQAARAERMPLGPIVSEFNGSIAERAVPEWQSVLDAMQECADVDAEAPVGFSGMTLATEIGMRLAAVDSRIGAAVFGSGFASEGLLDFARRITIPVIYLLSWDDPEIDRESGLALYDAFGSAEKSLHANPGAHSRLPWFETEESARFFARHLRTAASPYGAR